MSNKIINLPLFIQLNDKLVMQYYLKILPNGLMICKIKLVNPNNSAICHCDALIDTGAQLSLICKTVFDKLHYDGKDVQKTTLSSIDWEEEVSICVVKLFIPNDNWPPTHKLVAVKDITKRKEYQALIGMDILSEFQLVYNGQKKEAWLEGL